MHLYKDHGLSQMQTGDNLDDGEQDYFIEIPPEDILSMLEVDYTVKMWPKYSTSILNNYDLLRIFHL